MAHKGKTAANERLLEKIVRWGSVGVLSILPLLYFSGRAASYITSKEYFFIGFVDLLTIFWVWLLVSDTRYRLTRHTMLFLLPLAFFLISLTISALGGVDMSVSFFSTVESGTGLVLLYHAFIFTCIIASTARVQQRRTFMGVLQVTVFASVVLAIFTFFTGDNGLIHTTSKMLNGSSGGAMMGNSLLAGAYMLFGIFSAGILLLREKRRGWKVMWLLSLVVIVFSPVFFNTAIWKGSTLTTLIHSGYFFIGEARIATVSIIIGFITSICIWLTLHKEDRVKRMIGFSVLALEAIAAIVLACMIALPTTSLHHFFVNQGGNRTIDWQEAVQGIREKPLLGWGPENYHVVYQKYLDPTVFSPGHGNEVWALHPHNNTLEILVDGGILGLLLYLLVLGGVVFALVRLYRQGILSHVEVSLLSGMFLAFFLQQQMIYESITSYVVFFTFIGIFAGLADRTDERRVPVLFSGYAVAIGIVVLMFPIWLYGAYFPSRRVEELQQVADAHSDQRISMYQHLYHAPGSYAVTTDVEFYADSLFYSYDVQKELLKSNPQYQRIASQELAALLKAVAPIWVTKPYDYHLSLNLLQLSNLQFYLTGDAEQLVTADIYAQRALKLSPTDPQIYFAYAQTLVYEKKIAEAKAMLDKAISLNSNYQSAVDFRKMLQ